MGTGILINHWGEGLPRDLRYLVGLTHRVCAVGLLLAPMLLLLDPRHLRMAARMAFTWSADDLAWLRNAWAWLRSGGKRGALKRGAYNPGQRLWYLYVPAALLVFAATGAIKWIGTDALGKSAVETATLIHVTVAVLTDVLLLLHVYLKLGWPILRDGMRNTRYYATLRQRRRAVVPLGVR
jgi:hypothetical protein